MKKILSIVLVLTMVFSLTISAYAATGDVDVYGTIVLQDPKIDPGGDPSNPGSDPETGRAYDVTYHTAVYWWVTEETYNGTDYDVVDGDAYGPDEDVVNEIQSNIEDDIYVSFIGFAGDTVADGIADDLELYLTKDLAKDGVEVLELSGGYEDGAIAYEDPLEYGINWEFGFTGSYDGAPTATAISPTYTMTLGFSFAPPEDIS